MCLIALEVQSTSKLPILGVSCHSYKFGGHQNHWQERFCAPLSVRHQKGQPSTSTVVLLCTGPEKQHIRTYINVIDFIN